MDIHHQAPGSLSAAVPGSDLAAAAGAYLLVVIPLGAGVVAAAAQTLLQRLAKC